MQNTISAEELMKKDEKYGKYMRTCINNSTKIGYAGRFHPTRDEFIFNTENYKIFPYTLKVCMYKIFKSHIIPDDFSLSCENRTIISEHMIVNEDNSVYDFINKFNEEFIKIKKYKKYENNCLVDNNGYIVTIDNTEFFIEKNTFKIIITQEKFRSGEDLRCRINIESSEDFNSIYIVDPAKYE